MADINVERKGPSIWPWIVGLLVLALLIWAIAEMVDREPVDDVVIEEIEPEAPPVAVPAPEPEPVEVREFSELLPLGPEDRGQTVSVSGQVLGEPVQDGFWIRTAQDHAVFVRSERQVQRGQQVQVQGTLHDSEPAQVSNWMQQARLQDEPGYQQLQEVHQQMHVLETDAATAPPGAPGVTGR